MFFVLSQNYYDDLVLYNEFCTDNIRCDISVYSLLVY